MSLETAMDEVISLAAAVRRLKDENDSLMALAKLGRWVLQMRSEHECDDLSGEDIQNKLVELGLLVEVMATEPCGEVCYCNIWTTFPQACLRPTDKATVLDK